MTRHLQIPNPLPDRPSPSFRAAPADLWPLEAALIQFCYNNDLHHLVFWQRLWLWDRKPERLTGWFAVALIGAVLSAVWLMVEFDVGHRPEVQQAAAWTFLGFTSMGILDVCRSHVKAATRALKGLVNGHRVEVSVPRKTEEGEPYSGFVLWPDEPSLESLLLKPRKLEKILTGVLKDQALLREARRREVEPSPELERRARKVKAALDYYGAADTEETNGGQLSLAEGGHLAVVKEFGR